MREEIKRLWAEYEEFLEERGLFIGYKNVEGFFKWLVTDDI